MDRILFAQGVLIAFEAIDFRNRQIEGVGEADHLRRALQTQLKLRIAEPCGPNYELRIKVTACYQADPVIAVCPSNDGAIATIIGGNPRAHDVAENELLLGLILETHGDVHHVIIVHHAGAKVRDGRSEVRRLIAERLISANLRCPGWLSLCCWCRLVSCWSGWR